MAYSDTRPQVATGNKSSNNMNSIFKSLMQTKKQTKKPTNKPQLAPISTDKSYHRATPSNSYSSSNMSINPNFPTPTNSSKNHSPSGLSPSKSFYSSSTRRSSNHNIKSNQKRSSNVTSASPASFKSNWDVFADGIEKMDALFLEIQSTIPKKVLMEMENSKN